MARRCTTVPGFGVCCRAAQANQLNQTIKVKSGSSVRCASCTTITKRNGQPGFKFRFHKNSDCGIVSGCPALASQQQANIGFPASNQLTF